MAPASRLARYLLIGALVTPMACMHSAPPSTNVHFESGKHEPYSGEDYVVVGRAIGELGNDKRMRLLIVGHTDSVGDDESNRDLALRRAERVSEMIRDHDASLAGRIRTAYHGEAKPVASNDTEEGRALNRRVEMFFYLPKAGQNDTVQLQAAFGGKLEFSASATTGP